MGARPLNEAVGRYLAQFKQELRRLPEVDRSDAIREIESHVTDEIEAGTSPEVVLARLGEPRTLARSYLAAYHVDLFTEHASPPLQTVLGSMLFFASVGVGGIFVVPILALFSLLFALMAMILPIAGVARTLGANWVHMNGPNGPIPADWSIPLMLAVAILSAGIALGSWRLLRLYFSLVSRGYRRWLAPDPFSVRSRES